MTADVCTQLYNASSWVLNDLYCPAQFDRISCWPPTKAGIRRIIPCSTHIFPHASPYAYASRLCTNKSRWDTRSNYELCIGCSSDGYSNVTETFSIPPNYIIARKYFIVCANILSIILLIIGIFILLGNSRLRKYSRNILHVNIFFVFLIRSIIQLIAELYMNKGYFSHNVFERTDACNRTNIYFKEDHLLDCKLFTILMNYISSSVAHWFVFCEALYLYRLLRAKPRKDQVRWYILTGWLAPLYLTTSTYVIRWILKTDLYTCWFEPSIYDWILHGPNVVLQILNMCIFTYICTLLIRKLNTPHQVGAPSDQRRFSKYSRLTRSTLILLPLFGIHYFFFMWNTKPLLISNLIVIHLTVHTISSSLQGVLVALVYTIVNSEVQREVLRSFQRCLIRHDSSWEESGILRNYINKLENERLYSLGSHRSKSSIPGQYRPRLSSNFTQNPFTNRDRNNSSTPNQRDSL
ncbi:unnamed protein product [Adineta steineri]|uniref:Uncharacterized protein n=1 Tax=Adineta steineri TaxID=433720 RepID=A0A813PCI6_9BILA|nr:unnamed protein product [Adineta steineri]CAF3711731.1 unnamed protein product [Adineta steineri]